MRRKLEAANPSLAGIIQEAVAANQVSDRAKPRDYTAAQQHMAALSSAGKLSRNDVGAFAAANRFEETVAALAALCGLPIEAVDRAMTRDRPDAVLVLGKAVGISSEAARDILRMRTGARGISPGELEQCLATFARLRPSIARQVIKIRDNQSARFSRALA